MRRLALLTALLVVAPALARAVETRTFVHRVPDAATFERFSRVLNADRFGKFLIDIKTGEIYFFDVNLYRLHDEFVFAQFYHRRMTNADIPEYNLNYNAEKPRFILGYMTHHLKTGDWTFSFWEGDRILPKDIRRVHEMLEKTFYIKGLAWRPDSPLQEKLLAELKDLKTITNDRIYKAATYQSFNNGVAVGKLRVVPPGTSYDSLVFERSDIVVLQESYPDISPVSGIISTVFSTPLSHVNLRAREWAIPNAGYREAVKQYAGLDGKMVRLEVRDLDHTLREATADEVRAWQEQSHKVKTVVVPAGNLSVTELRPLSAMRGADVAIYGTKASALKIWAAHLPGVRIPEGFGVPFAFYADHMKRNGLDRELDKLLADPRFAADARWRKDCLERMRARIVAAPINPQVLEAVWAKVQSDLGGRGVFARSSTNAEDLEGFNGAGLYDTVPNVKDRAGMEAALKQVWASLWNFHAVEERTLFGMEQRAVYAGVLVQIGIDASAAGVLISKNLYDPEDNRSYTINAKRGLGLRVVGGTTVPEQIIYDTGNEGTKIISRSDDPTMLVFDEHGGVKEVENPNRSVILSEARAKALSTVVMKFVPLFPKRYPLDVEWVLEGDKVWIVQARPYVAK